MLTFAKAESLFATARDSSSGKPIATATRLVKIDNDSYGIRYHATVVVTISRNGSYKLNSGGYRTKTTKLRINDWSPATVYQKDCKWYLADGRPFTDGMTVDSNGREI